MKMGESIEEQIKRLTNEIGGLERQDRILQNEINGLKNMKKENRERIKAAKAERRRLILSKVES